MFSEKINFLGYSTKQLVDSFESIDDEKYPASAIEIYSLLQSKSESVAGLINERYDEGSGLLNIIASFLFFPFFTNATLTRSEMQEKRLRVKKLVVNQ